MTHKIQWNGVRGPDKFGTHRGTYRGVELTASLSKTPCSVTFDGRTFRSNIYGKNLRIARQRLAVVLTNVKAAIDACLDAGS